MKRQRLQRPLGASGGISPPTFRANFLYGRMFVFDPFAYPYSLLSEICLEVTSAKQK